ncbi:hypothetical protein ACIBSW_27020 [Actinoplanes sp. NPDC049668]|uniref:hypothetical protein n=1 Tax=unclassified Actinoplanes TaxID=2626549 RepID=UPI0033B714DD
MNTKRIATALGMAAAAAVATVVVDVAPASAGAYGCAGVAVDSDTITRGGKTLGWLTFYWDSASGDNCAVMVKNGDVLPGRVQMQVAIHQAEAPYRTHQDYGNYSWYAGPVKVDGRNKCVWANGHIDGVGGVIDDHCG